MEIQAASRNEKSSLGQGYDTKREEFVGRCVIAGLEYAGSQESRMTFNRSLDQSSMSRELGFEVGTKVRYGLVSGSVAAEFASSSSSSEYSDVTVYNYTIVLKNAKLKFADSIEAGLSAEARSARGTTEGNWVGENWASTCGDEVVSQITLGGKLMIAVKVEFATREDKSSFGLTASFQGPPAEIETSLKLASAKFGKRASVSIQAYQMGGDVRKLSSIFGTGPGLPSILTASLENPQGILDTLANAVKYSATDFVTQMDPNTPMDAPNGPAHLSYITSPWQELGIFPAPPILLENVNESRRLLSAAFERHAAYQRRLGFLLFGPIRLSPRQLQRCKMMQAAIGRNLALIQEAVKVAYSDFNLAVAKVAETIPQLQDFPPESFDVQPESFAQWWDMRNLPGTLQQDKAIVDSIAGVYIPTFNDFEKIEDKGLALQQQIEKIDKDTLFIEHPEWITSNVWSVFADAKIKSITLRGDAATLERARWLPHLQELSVFRSTHHPLQSLEGVESLSELESLSINGPVTSLQPLAGLNKLSHLSITQNAGALRGDLTPLAGKQSLRVVGIQDADIKDLSVLLTLPLEEVGLLGNPLESIGALAQILTLRELWFFDMVAGVTEFSKHPLLGNLFVSAKTIHLSSNDRPLEVWTRRGDTEMFDIKEEGGGTGDGTLTWMSVRSNGMTKAPDETAPTVVLNAKYADGRRRTLTGNFVPGAPTIDQGLWFGPGSTSGTWTAKDGAPT